MYASNHGIFPKKWKRAIVLIIAKLRTDGHTDALMCRHIRLLNTEGTILEK